MSYIYISMKASHINIKCLTVPNDHSICLGVCVVYYHIRFGLACSVTEWLHEVTLIDRFYLFLTDNFSSCALYIQRDCSNPNFISKWYSLLLMSLYESNVFTKHQTHSNLVIQCIFFSHITASVQVVDRAGDQSNGLSHQRHDHWCKYFIIRFYLSKIRPR